MRTLAPILGGLVGAVVAYLFLAERRIRSYQSKLRWIPALLAGGRLRELALVLVVTAAGGVLGVAFGAAMISALDSMTR